VICKVIEAKLSKDLSTFFSSMNVYCEVKFTSQGLQTGASVVEKKATVPHSGTNP